jgi:hypothetical protein
MNAIKVEPGPARRSRTVLLAGAAAAVLLIVLVVALVQRGDDAPATDQARVAAESPAASTGAAAQRVATRFLEAYGAFDVAGMSRYLADDASIASMDANDDPRLLASWLQATGYQQFVHACKQVGDSASGNVRCPFDFHALRSAEIGRGPFSGSAFDLVVREGKIVQVSQGWEVEKFSPQVWEPFAKWVSKAHPKAAAVMYADESLTGVRLSEASIRLWERNTQRYVDEVKRNRRSVSRASSTSSG